MPEKILIIGAGLNHEIDSSDFDIVYAANASILRLKNTSNVYLILSDAMLFDENNLNQHPKINNFSREESNKFRLKKYNSINSIKPKKVVISDSGEGINILKRLDEKKIYAESISIINARQLWSLYLASFNFQNFIQIFFSLDNKLKLKFLVQIILRKKMSTQYRPSMGLISIMLAIKENPSAIIFFDGINLFNDNNDREAHYEGLQKLTYPKNSHVLDQLYINIFIESNQIKLNPK